MKKRIGIIGGGQLARMLTFDAKKMGFHVTILDPTKNSPGGQVADEQIVASLSDQLAMEQLAQKSDYLTLEWELADSNILKEFAKKGIPINPSPKTLEIIKDKLAQKKFLQKNKVPVTDFVPISTKEDIAKAAKQFGYPLLLKARFDAYDGKGNALIANEHDIADALRRLKGRLLYAEKYIPFSKEVSVMIVRSIGGKSVSYPVSENIHQNNILMMAIVPARISKQLAKKVQAVARKVMKLLDGAGVFGIEMFLTKKGDVLLNEIAPRVHNSGHYTIEANTTSQFEQHIRAVTGLPLGDTHMIVKAVAMINILGERSGQANVEGLEKVLAIPGVTVHIYGKEETRLDRKMGHITVIGDTVKEVMQKAVKARKMIGI